MSEVDARRVEFDLRKTLKMDKNMQAIDRVMKNRIPRLETFLDENILRDSFKTETMAIL